jgi:hypothetical protein
MEIERYCRSRAYSNYSLRGYRKETCRQIDRVRSSSNTLWERGEEASNLQMQCKSLFSTPLSLQSLILTRFGRLDLEIAKWVTGEEGRKVTGATGGGQRGKE